MTDEDENVEHEGDDEAFENERDHQLEDYLEMPYAMKYALQECSKEMYREYFPKAVRILEQYLSDPFFWKEIEKRPNDVFDLIDEFLKRKKDV
ncbi:MAG: hypothetical protein Q6373_002580 [Candidatus Sigynarchaeota archaeon]